MEFEYKTNQHSSIFLTKNWNKLKFDSKRISIVMGYGIQCCWKTLMVHQTFVGWALYILLKFVKSLIRHFGLANGYVRCVWWFSWTLEIVYRITSMALFHIPNNNFKGKLWNYHVFFYSLTHTTTKFIPLMAARWICSDNLSTNYTTPS